MIWRRVNGRQGMRNLYGGKDMKIGIICKECGGDMYEITDGVQCDTCGFIIRSDFSEDRSEMVEEDD
jgi:ribosomal protein L37E